MLPRVTTSACGSAAVANTLLSYSLVVVTDGVTRARPWPYTALALIAATARFSQRCFVSVRVAQINDIVPKPWRAENRSAERRGCQQDSRRHSRPRPRRFDSED